MLDISQPNELWYTLEALLASLKDRVEVVISQMRSEYPNIREELKAATWQRLGEDHPVNKIIFMKHFFVCKKLCV